MAEIIKTYENEDIVITWKPGLCIHAKNCWKGLLPVFDPRRKPWIDPSAASSEEIMAQIERCPSGALSYAKKANEAETTAPEVTPCIVEMAPNGPLMVKGKIQIKRADGTVEEKENLTAFCRCGASANKPFCDGKHKAIDFKG